MTNTNTNTNTNTTTQAHGYFRKSKAYGLVCGIVLGLALLGAGAVSADETSAPDAQPQTQELAKQEVVAQPTSELTDAVDTATEAGLVVTEDTKQTVSDKATAEADYSEQAKAIEQATATQKANDEAYQKALADNQKVYDEASKRDDVLANKDGVVVYGKTNSEATGLDFYKDIHVVDNVGKTNTVAIDGSLSWTDKTAITDVKGMTLVAPSSNGVDTKSPYTFTDYKKGSSFTVTNVGKTKDGRNVHVKVTLNEDVKPISSTGTYQPTVVFYRDGTAFGTTFYNGQKMDSDYQFLDDDNNPLNILQAFVVGDMDWDQGSKVTFNKGNVLVMNPQGSKLVEEDGYIWDTTSGGVSGFKEAPKGTYLVVGYGDTLRYVHHAGLAMEHYTAEEQAKWDKAFAKSGSGTAFSLFGKVGNIDVLEVPVKPLPVKVSYHLNSYLEPLTVVKDVLNDKGISIDNGTLKLGETGYYTLEGAKILANGAKTLVKYDFEDHLDTTHDQYLDYKIYAFTPITLTDGTVIKTMADLKAFAKQSYDEATGRFYVSLNSDFLAKIAKDSDFQAKVALQFKRIATGEVTNQFTNHLAFKDDTTGQEEDVPVRSNTVKTETPKEEQPSVPQVPTPQQPTPNTPVQGASVATLPQTGEESQASLLATMFGLMTLGLAGLGLKKKNVNK